MVIHHRIGQVLDFEPRLDELPLRNPRLLADGRTKNAETCQPEEIPADIAQRPGCWSGEASDLVRGEVGLIPRHWIRVDLTHVGTAPGAVCGRANDVADGVGQRVHRHGTTALYDSKASYFPAA